MITRQEGILIIVEKKLLRIILGPMRLNYAEHIVKKINGRVLNACVTYEDQNQTQ